MSNKTSLSEPKDSLSVNYDIEAGQALIEASRRAQSVEPEHGELLKETVLQSIAEQWLFDDKVGVQAMRKKLGDILELSLTDSNINTDLAKLQFNIAQMLIEMQEQYIQSQKPSLPKLGQPIARFLSEDGASGEVGVEPYTTKKALTQEEIILRAKNS